MKILDILRGIPVENPPCTQFQWRKFQDGIGEPPWNYYFLQNLPEKEYPKYLSKLYKIKTGERLNLKHPKTFNEKIQWIKLYGVTDLMRTCIDKVKVRDYVKEKIGEEYLKPVLQVIPNESHETVRCHCEQKNDHLMSAWQSTLKSEHTMDCRADNKMPPSARNDGEFNALQPKITGACHSENVENQNVNSVDFQVVQNLKEEKNKKSQQACCHNGLISVSAIQNKKMLKHACINDEIQNEKINYTAVQHDSPTIDFNLKSTDVSTYFNRINWDKLPNAFVLKCNHGCKWQYIIKNKKEYLQNKQLIDLTRRQITNWLSINYAFFGGFELNYRNIEPKILIEPLIREQINISGDEIQVYCFGGIPKLFAGICGFNNNTSLYDENFNILNTTFFNGDNNIKIPADNLIKQSFVLSKQLAGNFGFVRIDWMIYKNKLYFEEMTFTPYSGFSKHINKKLNKQLGKLIKI